MKKSTISVKTNNEMKKRAVAELSAILYRMEKGKHNKELDRETVKQLCSSLKSAYNDLDDSVGTGQENLQFIAAETANSIENAKKALEQPITKKLEKAVNDLIYAVVMWNDVNSGKLKLDSESDLASRNNTRTGLQLEESLSRIDQMIADIHVLVNKLDDEIEEAESELAELDRKMLAESDERKLNDLFRSVRTAKSKIEMFTVRKSSYSACFNLLEMIHANGKQILAGAAFAPKEAADASDLLDLRTVSRIMDEPDSVVVVLRKMNDSLRDLAARTETIDRKVSSLDFGNTAPGSEALAYKEMLVQRQRDAQPLSEESAVETETKG